MRVILATGNPGKIDELRRILADLDVDLVPQGDIGLASAEETGTTFAENALIKARAACAANGEAALADDSGLEVDALGGAPGVDSAVYAGEHGADEANNAKLLAELADVPEEERGARFVCVAALVAPDGREWTARGVMEGRIVDAPRGDGGFGYDPLFTARGEERTNAQLPPHVKDERSHRGAAFRAIRGAVEDYLRGGAPNARHH